MSLFSPPSPVFGKQNHGESASEFDKLMRESPSVVFETFRELFLKCGFTNISPRGNLVTAICAISTHFDPPREGGSVDVIGPTLWNACISTEFPVLAIDIILMENFFDQPEVL